jgi:uncharacterized protein (TIGR02598 family)
MTLETIKRTCSAKSGFSLPEVAIAIAIAAIAVAVLMGLMPQGLESIREAGVHTAQSSIFRQIFAEVQSSDWGTGGGGQGWTGLATFNNQLRYYDDQGTRIDDGDSVALETQLSYVAKISFPDQSAKVPGSDTGYPSNSPNMMLLKVQVSDVPLKNYDFEQGKRHRTRTMVITRQYSTGTPQ